MKKVKIYTDGACSGNPGKGGWGTVLIYGDIQKEISGFEPHTTNNRMELLAAIKALESLQEPCQVDLYSDSSYLVNAIKEEWLDNWQMRGWKTANKKPVMNQDLWQRLVTLMRTHDVTMHKVKGHSTDELNNRCDYLATQEIENHR
ncbi:MAG: ribonuclease HI [Chlorobiales bacterium]|jgi:ribonuclease HI|nr:ribonuclease HI [Chlorobiales bacterium]